jgi:hypothetical protein
MGQAVGAGRVTAWRFSWPAPVCELRKDISLDSL